MKEKITMELIKSICNSQSPPAEIIVNDEDYDRMLDEAKESASKYDNTPYSTFKYIGSFLYRAQVGTILVHKENISKTKLLYEEPSGILDLTGKYH